MPVVIVEIVAPAGSWRAPEAMTYHRTYPLPPPTAQVGLLGAACGLPFVEAFAFVRDHGLKFGVGGWATGSARDLWKFQKLELVEKAKPPFRDILFREWRTELRMVLLIEADNSKIAEQITNAFRRPAFPLTAGPSDFLLHAVTVHWVEAEPVETVKPHHVLIPREITPHYEPFQNLAGQPLTSTITAPVVERVPVGYRFDENERRHPGPRRAVTFVADAIHLHGETVSGYCIEPQSRFFRYLEKQPPWIIPVHAW